MYERYTSPARETMSTAELAAHDKEFYAKRRRPDAWPVFGTYPQRLFTDERERQYAIAAVRALGGDPAGREEEGRFYSLHYESRPDTPRRAGGGHG
ncbi:hypothetical protein ACFTY8_40585 [Streptomyces mirabilis]|uniref:hypothetical protein n=1 Tax=Streptomyces mirabilis TaxID=68239 RepID=UPI0036312360